MIVKETSFGLGYLAALLGLLLALPPRAAEAVTFPGPAPGQATARIGATTIVIENQVLSVAWDIAGGRLKPKSVTDKLSGLSSGIAG